MLKESYHIQEDIIEWRRDFHMHPELGFHEVRTSERVAQELEKLGYRVRRGVGRTGVVADLGDEQGRCIAIRADMDALPILEANEVAYKSQNDGTMHACGHDFAHGHGFGCRYSAGQPEVSRQGSLPFSAFGRGRRRRGY